MPVKRRCDSHSSFHNSQKTAWEAAWQSGCSILYWPAATLQAPSMLCMGKICQGQGYQRCIQGAEWWWWLRVLVHLDAGLGKGTNRGKVWGSLKRAVAGCVQMCPWSQVRKLRQVRAQVHHKHIGCQSSGDGGHAYWKKVKMFLVNKSLRAQKTRPLWP